MWYHYLWKFWYAHYQVVLTEFRGGRGRGITGGGFVSPNQSKCNGFVEIATTWRCKRFW